MLTHIGTLLGYMGGNADICDDIILSTVLRRVEASQNLEPMFVMNDVTYLLQLFR